jgi:hypothetical protein
VVVWENESLPPQVCGAGCDAIDVPGVSKRHDDFACNRTWLASGMRAAWIVVMLCDDSEAEGVGFIQPGCGKGPCCLSAFSCSAVSSNNIKSFRSLQPK